MADYFTLRRKRSLSFGRIMRIAGWIVVAAGVPYGCVKAIGYTAAAIHQSEGIEYPQYEPPQVLPQTLDEMVGTTIEMSDGMKLHVVRKGTQSLNAMEQYLQKYGVEQ